jgi:hypothetical protein
VDVLRRLGVDSEKHASGRRAQPASEHEFSKVAVKGGDNPLLGCTQRKHFLIRCSRAHGKNRHYVVPVRLQTADCLQGDVLVSEETWLTQGRA